MQTHAKHQEERGGIVHGRGNLDRFLEISNLAVDGSATRNTMTLVPVGTAKYDKNFLKYI
jgi:hypothetical protein